MQGVNVCALGVCVHGCAWGYVGVGVWAGVHGKCACANGVCVHDVCVCMSACALCVCARCVCVCVCVCVSLWLCA